MGIDRAPTTGYRESDMVVITTIHTKGFAPLGTWQAERAASSCLGRLATRTRLSCVPTFQYLRLLVVVPIQRATRMGMCARTLATRTDFVNSRCKYLVVREIRVVWQTNACS